MAPKLRTNIDMTHAGHGQPDPADVFLPASRMVHQLLDDPRRLLHDGTEPQPRGRRVCLLRQEVGVQIRQDPEDVGRSQIDPNDEVPLPRKPEQSRPPPQRPPAPL